MRASLRSSRLGVTGGFVDALAAPVRRYRALWPAAVIVVVTLIAYPLTWGSMFDYLHLQTPLSYLPLLPLFSLSIALFTASRYRDSPPVVRDRQTDWLIAIPMLVAAVALVVVVPPMASTYYWSSRADVLSMAFFVAALVTLIYGVTWLWRIKASLLFLVLTWAALYLALIPGLMQSFTDATNSALATVVHALPLGVSLTSSPGVLLVHQANGASLAVSVGTACSGADAVLGFLLIGGVILTATGRGRGRKLLWMAVGLSMTFLVNVVRLTSVVALAAAGQPGLALGEYHAVVGLIVFGIVLAMMILLLPLFGLRPRARVASSGRGAGAASGVNTQPAVSRRRRYTTFATMTTLAILLGVANHNLAPFAAFQDGSGSPTVRPFSTGSAPTGWGVRYETAYGWATQYFGANATYTRYFVWHNAPGISSQAAAAAAHRFVYADVVRTDDKGSLDAYNLQNFFLLHNYAITTSRRVDVGGGVTALLLNYSDPTSGYRWATISWDWPVANQGQPSYERVALSSGLTTRGVDADISPTGGVNGFMVGVLNLFNGSHDDPNADSLYKGTDLTLQSDAAALIAFAVDRRQ
ncbi:MAG TPA: archaeosortase/exosortase family protein [Candidatus Dormibacteraeota bacterium]|nr:archaeosortase/exosortase family protein [Candidatus Dormibacteraeota bacterium]